MSIETIHQHLNYITEGFEHCDEGVWGLQVLGDYKYEDETFDDLIDSLMENEQDPKIGKRMNLMWIEKIKEISNWKLGEELYIQQYLGGEVFNCYFSKNKKDIENTVRVNYFIIEKNGYVSVRYFNNYIRDKDYEDEIKMSVMLRADSVYNDNNCNKLKRSTEEQTIPNMSMTTIMTKDQIKEVSLLGYYDATRNIDVKKTKAALKITSKIKKVYIMTDCHPEFENKVNKDIIYKVERAAYPKQEGGYWIKVDWLDTGIAWVTKNPIGKVIVVI